MKIMSAIEFFKTFCSETIKLYLMGVISFNGERQKPYFSVDKDELQEIVNIAKVAEYDSIADIEEFIASAKDGDLFEIVWDGNPDVVDKYRARYILDVIKKLD